DELHALHDTPVLHVQAGDDADFQHPYSPFSTRMASGTVTRPSYSARPTMAPTMPYSSAGRSSRASSSELTPPEAITGVVRCWASVTVASTLTPPSAPSRSMSV